MHCSGAFGWPTFGLRDHCHQGSCGLGSAFFEPGVAPAFVMDRADLISKQNLPLDQIWSGYTGYLRSRMLESSSPEARLDILEDCLAVLLVKRGHTARLGSTPGF